VAKLFDSNGVWNNGIFFVRVITGLLIFRHSLELFKIEELLEFLTQTKFPFPIFSGYAAKIIEFTGGIFLTLGFFTKWITSLLAICMYGVIYTMNAGNFFDGEHPFLFMLLFALFFFNGPGKWSLDYYLEHRFVKARRIPQD